MRQEIRDKDMKQTLTRLIKESGCGKILAAKDKDKDKDMKQVRQ